MIITISLGAFITLIILAGAAYLLGFGFIAVLEYVPPIAVAVVGIALIYLVSRYYFLLKERQGEKVCLNCGNKNIMMVPYAETKKKDENKNENEVEEELGLDDIIHVCTCSNCGNRWKFLTWEDIYDRKQLLKSYIFGCSVAIITLILGIAFILH